ncbi:hypothetical protein ACLMJK_006205 [Lecanora helva]
MADFTFINLSQPGQSKAKDIRKAVRSKAMRAYSQQMKQRAFLERAYKDDNSRRSARHRDSPSLVPVRSDRPSRMEARKPENPILLQPRSELSGLEDFEDIKHFFGPSCGHSSCDENGCSMKIVRWKPSNHPQTLLGNGMSDPFDTFPIAGNSRYNAYILHHFASVMARKYLPIDPGTIFHNPLTAVWIPQAMDDPALFLATINVAAMHLDTIYRRPCNPSTIARKGETIRLLKKRLLDPTQALTNPTIASVVMLAGFESLGGNTEELQLHMKALKRMVALRGGLEGLGWKGVLHMIIAWEDLLSSSMMSTRPHFTRVQYGAVAHDFTFPNPIASLAPDLSLEPYHPCVEMIKIIENIRYLTTNLRGYGSTDVKVDPIIFSNMRAALTDHLLKIRIQQPPEKMTLLEYQLEAVRIGALIYIGHVFIGIQSHCMVVKRLKTQLIDIISEGEKRYFGDFRFYLRRGFLTWAFWMGGIGHLDSEEQTWFARRIAISIKAWHREEMACWVGFERYLKSVAWDDRLRSPNCMALWDRVQSMCAEDRELADGPACLVEGCVAS